MFKFPKLKRSLALTLALLLSFSLFGCTTEELETAGEIIGTVADIADAVISESSDSESADSESVDSGEGEITAPPADKELPQIEEGSCVADENYVEQEEEPEQQVIEQPEEATPAIDCDGIYTTKEDVALYLWTYGELPQNFMTKNEARKLGWEGGGLDDYAPDMCIGGDSFGNREGILPDTYKYIECDIDTLNRDKRGAKRLVFSKGCEVIYYTDDHYESFELLYGEE